MLSKESILGLWQKYSGRILSRTERLAFYENCERLRRFDELTLRTALNFCRKEGDFSLERVAQLATAVRRGTVSRVLRRTEKDKLIERIIFERKQLVPMSRLRQRFQEAVGAGAKDLDYSEVERTWKIAALTLAEKDERIRSYLKPKAAASSFFERLFSINGGDWKPLS